MKIDETSQPGTEPPSLSDREGFRAGLEKTRREFHNLLDTVSDDRWLQRKTASTWTVREVFVHLTWSLEYLPREVAMARQGKGMFNMPKWLADPLSYLLIRWLARGGTQESVRKRYDAAMDAAIAALETVPDSDWYLGARFYGHGSHTVADLFRTPAHHLAEHTGGT